MVAISPLTGVEQGGELGCQGELQKADICLRVEAERLSLVYSP